MKSWREKDTIFRILDKCCFQTYKIGLPLSSLLLYSLYFSVILTADKICREYCASSSKKTYFLMLLCIILYCAADLSGAQYNFFLLFPTIRYSSDTIFLPKLHTVSFTLDISPLCSKSLLSKIPLIPAILPAYLS